MVDIRIRQRFPYIWIGRYLDDILVAVPSTENNSLVIDGIQEIYKQEKQVISIPHAGQGGFAAWLGFEIHPSGKYRIYMKQTWVNLFSPLYDSISPRIHIGYLIIMAIRFTIFTSKYTYFLYVWTKFCDKLPARGYPPCINQLILDKIL